MTEVTTDPGRIGEILIRRGWLTQDQLEDGLERQEAKGGRLGEILTASGTINPQQLGEALSEQTGIRFLPQVDTEEIDSELATRLPINFLKQARALPLWSKDSLLTIAVADPTDLARATMVARQLDAVPEWVFVQPELLMNLTNGAFEQGSATDAEDLVDEFGDVLQSIGEMDTGEPIDLLDATDEAPIIRLINSMMFRALRERASDIHFEPFESDLVIRFRVDGVLYEILRAPKHTQANLVSRIKVMAQLNIAEKRLPQDGRIRLKVAGRDVDVRVSTLPTQFGERVVLRLLERSNVLFNLEELGFDDTSLGSWQQVIRKNHGIVLVTGPTGSGKTTTLYASLSSINSSEQNIITIEDPVEYQLKGVGQIQVNPKIDLTFAGGLRSILRQDPDVILIGEIRDIETAEIAIQASLTGHLVFSTLHTNDAPSAVTRLVDMGLEPFLVSSSLLAVLAQRLVRTLCVDCKEMHKPQPQDLKGLGLKPADIKGHSIYRPVGCPACMGTGYRGRTTIHELLLVDEKVRTLILSAKDATTIRRAAVQHGMATLRDAGIRRILQGVSSIEEIMRVTQEDLDLDEE